MIQHYSHAFVHGSVQAASTFIVDVREPAGLPESIRADRKMSGPHKQKMRVFFPNPEPSFLVADRLMTDRKKPRTSGFGGAMIYVCRAILRFAWRWR